MPLPAMAFGHFPDYPDTRNFLLYHIIAPRAPTWVSDSTFACLGHQTCLFNEGTEGESQRLVIRNSTIEGGMDF